MNQIEQSAVVSFVSFALAIAALPSVATADVRSVCGQDIRKHCSDVARNKQAISTCLNENRQALSKPCKGALRKAAQNN